MNLFNGKKVKLTSLSHTCHHSQPKGSFPSTHPSPAQTAPRVTTPRFSHTQRPSGAACLAVSAPTHLRPPRSGSSPRQPSADDVGDQTANLCSKIGHFVWDDAQSDALLTRQGNPHSLNKRWLRSLPCLDGRSLNPEGPPACPSQVRQHPREPKPLLPGPSGPLLAPASAGPFCFRHRGLPAGSCLLCPVLSQ